MYRYEEVEQLIENIKVVKRYKDDKFLNWELTPIDGYVIYDKTEDNRYNEDGSPNEDFVYLKLVGVPASIENLEEKYEAIEQEEWMNIA